MRLSALDEALRRRPVPWHFAVYLADPDKVPGDTVDMELVSVGWVEASDPDRITLVPASAGLAPDPDMSFSNLGSVLAAVPRDLIEVDLQLLIDLPLLRNDRGEPRYGPSPVRGIHVDWEAEEFWFLTRPNEEFAFASPTAEDDGP